MIKNFFQKGITVTEILIIVATISILTVVVVPQFSKIKENQVFKNGIENILSSVNKARTLTLSSLDSSEYGIHFQHDKIFIFKGKIFTVNDINNEIILITEPASISNVTLSGVSGTSGDLYFNRLSGSPSTTGTVTISTPSYSKIITIYATGLVSVN